MCVCVTCEVIMSWNLRNLILLDYKLGNLILLVLQSWAIFHAMFG